MTPRYSFRLKPKRDSDLIDWLDSLGEGERSYFIRHALRQALPTTTTNPLQNQTTATPKKIDMPTDKVEPKPEISHDEADLNEISDQLNKLSTLFEL